MAGARGGTGVPVSLDPNDQQNDQQDDQQKDPQNDPPDTELAPEAETPATKPARTRRRAASRPAGPPAPVTEEPPEQAVGSTQVPPDQSDGQAEPATDEDAEKPAAKVAKKSPPRKRVSRKKAAAAPPEAVPDTESTQGSLSTAPGSQTAPTSEITQVSEVPDSPTGPAVEEPDESAESAESDESPESVEAAAAIAAMPLFQPPAMTAAPRRRRATAAQGPARTQDEQDSDAARPEDVQDQAEPDQAEAGDAGPEAEDEDDRSPRKRRRRGGRGRRPKRDEDAETESTGPDEDGALAEDAESVDGEDESSGQDEDGEEGDSGGSSRRRRRRRRRGSSGGDGQNEDDPPNTVTKVRSPRSNDVSGVRGSTRLEAKKQRRREGREAGRRRPVITEAEFLARRESVDRVMVVRENDGRTQIAVLEDGVLVEHYVARRTQTSMVGNVYLGRVQNVLPSMEAAFVDIGKGRNAVLYAGEVNWDAAGLEGQAKRIENALSPGESVLVQVTKDPIGHKGARLTSQISLPGRYLVYVPDGSMTGISRKLPDTERSRLKRILRDVVPDKSGVIVRTAAEGASEEELGRDVSRLSAQWDDISAKSRAVNAPALLYGEPDLAIRVVRDIFNEDFSSLLVAGDEVWETLHAYIGHVAPDLVDRLTRWNADEEVDGTVRGDVFAAHRVDEQLAKAMDRKVWLPSGGSLVIDRTEAMTVVDVNTGKFTGAGGNLEETVTKNNLEAAEELVRQLRLRDIGGIIVVDFIDMVLESNRDLVLRRLLECLGRDRTKHQVAEVTSLGLVQMTRKRVGQGLLEVFSESCEHCGGRGLIVRDQPVEKRQQENAPARAGGRRGGRSSGRSGASGGSGGSAGGAAAQSTKSATDEGGAEPGTAHDAIAG